MKEIFLLLTGEDENKRPRSKKLIKIIKSKNLFPTEYKIIITGKSSFQFDVKETEAKRCAKYLHQKNIPLENIILEQEAMDTLGNMVFSYPIIKQLIYSSKQIEIINIITEGFHLNRSKKIFEKIYRDLIYLNPQINIDYIGANSLGISSFFWKRKLKTIFSKIKKDKKINSDLKEYFSKIIQIDKKYMVDFLIEDILLTDFDIFRLKYYEDFKDYLFSLPVYNQYYNSTRKLPMEFSLYAKLINLSINNKEK